MTAATVVRTGTANLASVLAALQRCGMVAGVTSDAREVERADRLVLPGVGSFAAMMQSFTVNDLVAPLRDRLLAGRATLAICLGLQVLATTSDESPGIAGLGLLPDRIARFDSTKARVPQLGWNWVEPAGTHSLVRSGYAYFANSYRLSEAPVGWCAAYSDHGGRFVAALERGGLLACQFHPELSGAWGEDLIRRWTAFEPIGALSC